MIKIYDKEVFSFDIGEYDRSRILNQCWANSKCSELKFLVYDGEELIGAMSYQDILADKPVTSNCLSFGEDLFDLAREYFRKNGNRQSCIPVCQQGGEELMFLLVFVENRLFDGFREGELFHEYWEIDFNSDMNNLDFTLLERANGFYFFELEEYTYELASLIRKIYPEKQVCFGDKMAKEFFPESDIKIYESTWEFQEKEHPAGCLYINSKRNQTDYRRTMPYLSGHYRSIQMMESLLWCRKRIRMGNKNEGKTVFLMDFCTDTHGMVDILRFGYIWVMIARSRGWIPVMKLDRYPNQYLEVEGENMWEYFFCPVSEISLTEAMQSAEVVSAWENELHLGETVGNPYFSDSLAMVSEEAEFHHGKAFNQIVRKNSELERFLEENLLPEFKSGDNRILGVVARGTDYTKEMLEKANGYIDRTEVKGIQQIIRRARECAGSWNCNYIFVATEDAGYFQRFSDAFGAGLLYVEQKRVEMDVNDTEVYIFEKLGLKREEKRAFVKQYLLAVYCLSKCQVLISNRKHCGADLLAKMWNAGRYEYTEII